MASEWRLRLLGRRGTVYLRLGGGGRNKGLEGLGVLFLWG